MDGLALAIDLVEHARELQHAVQRGIENAAVVEIGIGDLDAVELALPDRLGLRLGLLEPVAADLAAQVSLGLFEADERRRHLDADLLALARLEADDRADMIALARRRRGDQTLAVPGLADGEVVVEFGDEVIVEIVGHAAVVVADIAGDAALGLVDRDHRAAGIAVEDDVRVVALREGEAELRGAVGRRDLRCDVVIGEIDLVAVRPAVFRLVAVPGRAFVLLHLQRAGRRHQRERGIVVHPRTGLVRLLDAVDLVRVVGVAPAAVGLAGDRRPEVHAPRHRHRGIGVAIGQGVVGIGPHQRVDQIDRRLVLRLHRAIGRCRSRRSPGLGQYRRGRDEGERRDRRYRAAQIGDHPVSHIALPEDCVGFCTPIGRGLTPALVITTGSIRPSAAKTILSIAIWRCSPRSVSSGRR